MSRDLQEGPTAAEIEGECGTCGRDTTFDEQGNPELCRCDIERDAAYYNQHRNTGNIHLPVTPTIAVFVEGGQIQDICFDGAVRVVVIDFDAGEDDPDDERNANYTSPDGRTQRVGVGLWENYNTTNGQPAAGDRATVRAALRAAGEVC